jgi:hypothetical protein
MTRKESWARPVVAVSWQPNAAKLGSEVAVELGGDFVVKDQQPVVVGDADEVAVQQPMYGAGQRNAVLDDVGPPLSTDQIWAAWTSGRPPPLTIFSAVTAQVSS